MDVSVVVITYNQENTIDRTLKSIISQETEHSYEILISDDASSDRTAEILREWKKKYPDRIRLHVNRQNVGPTANAYPLLMLSKGKFIASLEGDDYWSDNSFLQRQVDFLKTHEEYIGIQDKCLVVDKDDEPISSRNTEEGNEFWKFNKSVYTLDDFAEWKMPGHLSAMVYRNIYPYVENSCRIYRNIDRYVGDRTILMLLSARGKIYCTDKISLHYMLNEANNASNWMAINKQKNMRLYEYRLICRLEKYVKSNYHSSFSAESLMRSKIAAAVSILLFDRSCENTRVLWGIINSRGNMVRDGIIAFKAAVIKLYWIAKGQPEYRVNFERR